MDSVDIEAELVTWLSRHLSVPVSTRVPSPAPPAFVQLRRSGGAAALIDAPQTDVVRDRAVVDVFAWASDEDESYSHAAAVRRRILSAKQDQPFSTPCYRAVEVMGMQRSDDTLAGSPARCRVWSTYEIHTRYLET